MFDAIKQSGTMCKLLKVSPVANFGGISEVNLSAGVKLAYDAYLLTPSK